jgi:dihydrolipoamide dehydrogenase
MPLQPVDLLKSPRWGGPGSASRLTGTGPVRASRIVRSPAGQALVVRFPDGTQQLYQLRDRSFSDYTKLPADVLLSAVGVSSNIEGIGLEESGVKTDKGKIVVDKYYQTNVPGVYAIGDCVPGQALAHVASKEGIICVEAIGYNEKKYNHQPEALDYNNVPGCTYCTPEIASVGFTEKAAKEAGYEIKVGKFPLSVSGKATAAGAPEGFIKVIFDAKYGEWLGTHMIGYNVTEIIAQTVTARKLETTYHEVLNSIHPHPTISEGVKDAIEVAYGEAIHL